MKVTLRITLTIKHTHAVKWFLLHIVAINILLIAGQILSLDQLDVNEAVWKNHAWMLVSFTRAEFAECTGEISSLTKSQEFTMK